MIVVKILQTRYICCMFLFLVPLLFGNSAFSQQEQNEEIKKLTKRLERSAGKERNEILLKLSEQTLETGVRLAYYQEIINETDPGDTSLRIVAIQRAIYSAGMINLSDEMLELVTLLETEYTRHQEKLIEPYLYVSIGFNFLEDHQKALEFINIAEKLALKYDESSIPDVLHRRAIENINLKRFDKAELDLKQLEAIEDQGFAVDPAYKHGLELAVFYRKNEINKLKNKLDRIDDYISFFQVTEQRSFFNNCNLVEYFSAVGQLEKAEYYLDLSRNYLIDSSNYVQGYFYKSSRKYYLAKEDFLTASQYSDSIILLKNQRLKDNLKEVVKYYTLSTKFKAEGQELQIQLKNNELKNIIAEQKIGKLIIILLLAVSTGLCFSIYFLTKSKRKNLALKELQLITENLKYQVDVKRKELADRSFQLASKNQLLADVKVKLKKEKFESKESKVIKSILSEVTVRGSEKLWKEFELYFAELNSKFFKKILSKHPDLTAAEKRLVVFLKLNLDTKSISMITGKSTNGIEVARTRLRKKMGLTNSALTFTMYFDKIENSED